MIRIQAIKKQRPQERYDRQNTKLYGIKVVIPTERDIYERLESIPNKSGYIKALIRADLQRRVPT